MWDQLDGGDNFQVSRKHIGSRRKAIHLGGDRTLLRLVWDSKEGGKHT